MTSLAAMPADWPGWQCVAPIPAADWSTVDGRPGEFWSAVQPLEVATTGRRGHLKPALFGVEELGQGPGAASPRVRSGRGGWATVEGDTAGDYEIRSLPRWAVAAFTPGRAWPRWCITKGEPDHGQHDTVLARQTWGPTPGYIAAVPVHRFTRMPEGYQPATEPTPAPRTSRMPKPNPLQALRDIGRQDWREDAACIDARHDDGTVAEFVDVAPAAGQHLVEKFCRTCPVIAACRRQGDAEAPFSLATVMGGRRYDRREPAAGWPEDGVA